MEKTSKRTARDIKVDKILLTNKNINVRIGTVENRDCPETVYAYISFWINPKKTLENKSQDFLKRKLQIEFKKIYDLKLKSKLSSSYYFTNEKENIYIAEIPENFNYNNKKNFISIELHLHTLNTKPFNKIPLSNKKNTRLFTEVIKIVEIIGNSRVLKGNSGFEIKNKSM